MKRKDHIDIRPPQILKKRRYVAMERAKNRPENTLRIDGNILNDVQKRSGKKGKHQFSFLWKRDCQQTKECGIVPKAAAGFHHKVSPQDSNSSKWREKKRAEHAPTRSWAHWRKLLTLRNYTIFFVSSFINDRAKIAKKNNFSHILSHVLGPGQGLALFYLGRPSVI